MVAVGVTAWDPESALDPVQPPDAVQETAVVLDQVRVEEAPAMILVGEAVRVVVGRAGVQVPLVTGEPPVQPVGLRVRTVRVRVPLGLQALQAE